VRAEIPPHCCGVSREFCHAAALAWPKLSADPDRRPRHPTTSPSGLAAEVAYNLVDWLHSPACALGAGETARRRRGGARPRSTARPLGRGAGVQSRTVRRPLAREGAGLREAIPRAPVGARRPPPRRRSPIKGAAPASVFVALRPLLRVVHLDSAAAVSGVAADRSIRRGAAVSTCAPARRPLRARRPIAVRRLLDGRSASRSPMNPG
jgi:hypothetical protein